jgi:carbon-monoxide dehydrogenase iron sulfur subunit
MKRIAFNSDLCVTCESCEIACAVRHSRSKEIHAAYFELPQPKPRLRVIVKGEKPKIVRCQHCKKPKCIEACEVGAIYREGDLVLQDAEKCTGCGKCVEACPFNAMFMDEERGVAFSCDNCEGYEDCACVEACPVDALTYKDLEKIEIVE